MYPPPLRIFYLIQGGGDLWYILQLLKWYIYSIIFFTFEGTLNDIYNVLFSPWIYSYGVYLLFVTHPIWDGGGAGGGISQMLQDQGNDQLINITNTHSIYCSQSLYDQSFDTSQWNGCTCLALAILPILGGSWIKCQFPCMFTQCCLVHAKPITDRCFLYISFALLSRSCKVIWQSQKWSRHSVWKYHWLNTQHEFVCVKSSTFNNYYNIYFCVQHQHIDRGLILTFYLQISKLRLSLEHFCLCRHVNFYTKGFIKRISRIGQNLE